jgi:polyisoprenoid-binding protein YceI
MKQLTLLIGLFLLMNVGFAQRYITKNGHIKFYSETPIETIEAHNRQVSSALDASTGEFVFKVLMRSFEFEKALMQEHFNENYVESDKFPNATFKGKVKNIADINVKSSGEYAAEVEGTLTIHGVEQEVREKGKFTVEGGVVTGDCTFIVKPADYDIKIPNTVINNIAEEIEVTVTVSLEEYKK